MVVSEALGKFLLWGCLIFSGVLVIRILLFGLH